MIPHFSTTLPLFLLLLLLTIATTCVTGSLPKISKYTISSGQPLNSTLLQEIYDIAKEGADFKVHFAQEGAALLNVERVIVGCGNASSTDVCFYAVRDTNSKGMSSFVQLSVVIAVRVSSTTANGRTWVGTPMAVSALGSIAYDSYTSLGVTSTNFTLIARLGNWKSFVSAGRGLGVMNSTNFSDLRTWIQQGADLKIGLSVAANGNTFNTILKVVRARPDSFASTPRIFLQIEREIDRLAIIRYKAILELTVCSTLTACTDGSYVINQAGVITPMNAAFFDSGGGMTLATQDTTAYTLYVNRFPSNAARNANASPVEGIDVAKKFIIDDTTTAAAKSEMTSIAARGGDFKVGLPNYYILPVDRVTPRDQSSGVIKMYTARESGNDGAFLTAMLTPTSGTNMLLGSASPVTNYNDWLSGYTSSTNSFATFHVFAQAGDWSKLGTFGGGIPLNQEDFSLIYSYVVGGADIKIELVGTVNMTYCITGAIPAPTGGGSQMYLMLRQEAPSPDVFFYTFAIKLSTDSTNGDYLIGKPNNITTPLMALGLTSGQIAQGSAKYSIFVKGEFDLMAPEEPAPTPPPSPPSPPPTPINPVINNVTCNPPEGTGYTMFDFSVDAEGGDLEYAFQYWDEFSESYRSLRTFGPTPTFSTRLPLSITRDLSIIVKFIVRNPIGQTNQFTKVVVKPLTLGIRDELQIITEESKDLSDPLKSIALASIVNYRASRLSDKDQKRVIQEVAERIVSYSVAAVDSASDSTLVDQRMSTIELTTRTSGLISAPTQRQVLASVDQTLQNRTGVIDTPFTTFATLISNIAEDGFNNPETATEVKQSVNVLSSTLLSSQSEGSASTIVSRNFELQVRKQGFNSSISGSEVRSEGSSTFASVSIPSGLEEQLNHEATAYVMTVFPQGKHPYLNSENSQDIVTPILEFNIRTEDGGILPVNNLKENFVLVFEKKVDINTSSEEFSFGCRYWSELNGKWETNGVKLISENETHIVCSSNHLTSFSAFILYSKKDPKQPRHAVAIAFNALFLTICVPLFVLLLCLTGNQPLRGRFVAPYLGISAIIVDSILQGIVRNSLLYSGQSLKAVNGFSYVIMLTANPLTVVALFVYLWQSVRYILTRNIYHIMSRENLNKTRFIRIARIFTSKIVYLTATLAIGSLVLAYFVALVAVAATRNTESGRKTITTVQSISFAAFMICAGLGILATMIIDLMWSIQSKSQSMGKQDSKPSLLSKIWHWFVTDDPLRFRIESVLILLAILALLVLYPLGIASVIEDENQALASVTLAFEFVLTFTKIVAFGGFVAFVTLKSFLQRRSHDYSEQQSEESSNDFVAEILRNPLGYQITYEYCKAEFSLENLLLWKDLDATIHNDKSHSEETSSNIKTSLNHLYETYLARGCDREVNLANNVKKKFEAIRQMESPSASDATIAYNVLYSAVTTNLADTMSRLVSTAEYKQFMSTKEVEKELKQVLH